MAVHCSDFEALTQAYLDEELAEHELSDFESHRLECKTCRSLLATESAFRTIVRERLTPPPAPSHLISNIQTLLDQEDHQTRQDGSSASLVLGAA